MFALRYSDILNRVVNTIQNVLQKVLFLIVTFRLKKAGSLLGMIVIPFMQTKISI